MQTFKKLITESLLFHLTNHKACIVIQIEGKGKLSFTR